ncbi:MAG: RNA methyltransferase [Rhodothermia bacterium]|nr:RNA methyltransferase [Rhodothermia bacterium]
MPKILAASKNLIKQIKALQQKKFRKRDGLFVVEGLRSVWSALNAPKAELVYLLVEESTSLESDVQALIARVKVGVYLASASDFERCSDVVHAQGILAVAKIPPIEGDVLKTCSRILTLNGVQDPGNVGTLIRTAAWFGIDAVLADATTADFFQSKVVRATMGGIWDVHLFQTQNVTETLSGLKQSGFRIYAADLSGTPLNHWSPQIPATLIAGSEAHGVSNELRAICDEMVYISGAGNIGVESLNVAIATSIITAAWAASVG